MHSSNIYRILYHYIISSSWRRNPRSSSTVSPRSQGSSPSCSHRDGPSNGCPKLAFLHLRWFLSNPVEWPLLLKSQFLAHLDDLLFFYIPKLPIITKRLLIQELFLDSSTDPSLVEWMCYLGFRQAQTRHHWVLPAFFHRPYLCIAILNCWQCQGESRSWIILALEWFFASCRHDRPFQWLLPCLGIWGKFEWTCYSTLLQDRLSL